MGDSTTPQLAELKDAALTKPRGTVLTKNHRQRIMVVDDDREMQKLLNRALNMEGYDTIVIADGAEALAMLGETSPDLIILDDAMPGLNGYQTLDLIREHSNVPVIMLSNGHKVESLQRALFLGADDYISKPFSIRALVARIRAKLRRCMPPQAKRSG